MAKIQKKRDRAFKAYYLTCSLLSQFEGIHAMMAEEELFNKSFDFVEEKISEEKFIDHIEFFFGLTKKHLRRALKDYDKYANHNDKYL